jgi:hypothetical protein
MKFCTIWIVSLQTFFRIWRFPALRQVGLSGVPPFGSIAIATASPPLQSLTGCLQKVFFAKERHLFSNSHAELDSASVDVKHQNRVALIINAFPLQLKSP